MCIRDRLGFVHFAIRVAIENMDAAVKRKEVRAAEDEKQREAIKAEREARQINRAAKEAVTRLDTAWQETAWSPGNEPNPDEDLGDDVEW